MGNVSSAPSMFKNLPYGGDLVPKSLLHTTWEWSMYWTIIAWYKLFENVHENIIFRVYPTPESLPQREGINITLAGFQFYTHLYKSLSYQGAENITMTQGFSILKQIELQKQHFTISHKGICFCLPCLKHITWLITYQDCQSRFCPIMRYKH